MMPGNGPWVGLCLPFYFLSLMKRSATGREACGLGVTLTWVQTPLMLPGSLAFRRLNLSFCICTTVEHTCLAYLL